MKAAALAYCRHAFEFQFDGKVAHYLRGSRVIETIEGDTLDREVEVCAHRYEDEAIIWIKNTFGDVSEVKKLRDGTIGVRYRSDYNSKRSEEIAYVKVDPWPDQDEGYWKNPEYER